MISGSIALTFTAGMVAAFNPCGFSLLPAYIGAFVTGDEVEERVERRVLRAAGVAGLVSIGFIAVFASVGLIIDSIASEARRQLPWVTIAIGAVLVVTGTATAAGWKPSIGVRGPSVSNGASKPAAMVGYGVTYAVASLSCTIGPFLAVTSTALSQSVLRGLATYVTYALGMGVIILILSVASALAHTAVARHMRRLSRIAPRVGGVFMIVAGLYAIWYGRWELAVYGGDLGTDPIINAMENVRLWFIDSILTVGPQRLALIAIIGVALTVTIARLARRPDRYTESGDR